MKFFIIAGSNSYGFMHGMYQTAVVEYNVDETNKELVERELNDYGREMSAEVIDSYDVIQLESDEDDEFYDEELEDYDEAVAEELYWEVWQIKKGYQDLSIDELEELVRDYGDGFPFYCCEDEIGW